jgi:hypothetical protein
MFEPGGGCEVELLGEMRRPVRKEKREGRVDEWPADVAGRGSSLEYRGLLFGMSEVLERWGRSRSGAVLRLRIWSS